MIWYLSIITEALTSNWSLCFSFSNLWDGPRYFYGNLRCEYLACAVSSIWWYSEWISLGMRCWNSHLESGGFVSKYLGNPLLSTGRSETLISQGQTKWAEGDSNSRPLGYRPNALTAKLSAQRLQPGDLIPVIVYWSSNLPQITKFFLLKSPNQTSQLLWLLKGLSI